MARHTYLAEGLTVIKEAVPLGRGCSIVPLHCGMVDSYNFPKRGKLGSIIFVSGGLRSRYPLFRNLARWKIFVKTFIF